MSQNIKIPVYLYNRLSLHAKGFDRPADVIERILDYYEEKTGFESSKSQHYGIEKPESLEIVYYPSNEQEFKNNLLQEKKAFVLLHKIDGSKELKEWNAQNISPTSDVNANLRSGYLRGWKNKGIFKAEVSTKRSDLM